MSLSPAKRVSIAILSLFALGVAFSFHAASAEEATEDQILRALIPAKPQALDPAVGEHLVQQPIVVAANVGTCEPDADPAVPPRDIVDQIAERLWNRSARPRGQQRM